MNIVVCIKPVKSEFVYPNEVRNETFVMNPYDLYALEKCLELKKYAQCSITCISMGPMDSQYMLTKAIAMGADEGILLNDNEFMGSDTVATTYILSKAIDKLKNVDLVACGDKSIDGETGQVVYGISERLNYTCISNVENLLEISSERLILQHWDKASKITARLSLPSVISFNDFSLNQPYINLVALKRAKRKEISIWGIKELGADIGKCGVNGSKTKVMNVKNEIIKKDSTIVNGTVTDKANFIFNVTMGRTV